VLPAAGTAWRAWRAIALLGALAGMSGPAAGEPQSSAGLAQWVAGTGGFQGRVLWIDGPANLSRLSSQQGVAEVFARCRRANINTVVVDVKPLSGHALYASRLAPHLVAWGGKPYPADFDLLAAAIAEGRRQGIRVHACVNVFCEGHKIQHCGPIYEKPEQQSTVYECRRTVIAPDGVRSQLALGDNMPPAPDELRVYTRQRPEGIPFGEQDAAVVYVGGTVTQVVDGSLPEREPLRVPGGGCVLVGKGSSAAWLLEHVRPQEGLGWESRPELVPITQSPSEEYGMFVIPTHPAAREYALRVVDEIASSYPVDGIIFDRMRYASIRSDFSPLSREQFEAWLGRRVERFPEDIYEWDAVPYGGIRRGPLFNAWVEWRARNIRDWLAEAAAIVRARRSEAKVGVYVGSWYPVYYDVGVNWAADDFAAGYDWMSSGFPETGFARLLDYVCTGCYYRVPTREHARRFGLPEESSVQAAAELSNRVVNDAAFVYAGIYLLDYQGNPDLFRRAIAAALRHSQGVMLFDLVYLDLYGWWSILEETFPESRTAPHDWPGLLDSVRRAHAGAGEGVVN
jgi:uncharacterized lipoprotein YddW (UPF0748 family)